MTPIFHALMVEIFGEFSERGPVGRTGPQRVGRPAHNVERAPKKRDARLASLGSSNMGVGYADVMPLAVLILLLTSSTTFSASLTLLAIVAAATFASLALVSIGFMVATRPVARF